MLYSAVIADVVRQCDGSSEVVMNGLLHESREEFDLTDLLHNNNADDDLDGDRIQSFLAVDPRNAPQSTIPETILNEGIQRRRNGSNKKGRKKRNELLGFVAE